MIKNRSGLQRAFLLFSVLGAVVICTFGMALADGPWLPENISTLGEEIDRLYRMIFWLVAVLFVLTEGTLIYFIIKYRRREGQKASYHHESQKLEVIWSVIPGLILVFLAVYQWNAWANARLRPPDPTTSVRVQILAQQFEWNVRYPGPDDRFGTDDDVTLKNQLYIPEGKDILMQVRTVDVIHAFFLPHLRVKQDIVPGVTSLMWFDANKTGTYEIACAELCGLGHYRMRGLLQIKTMDEYEAWLQSKYDANVPPADWGWDWDEGV